MKVKKFFANFIVLLIFSAVVFLAVAALAATVLVVAVFSAVFLAALVLSLVTLARLLALAVAVFFAAAGVASLDAPLVAVEALRGLTVLLLIPGSALGLLLLASVDLLLAAFGLLVALAFLATGLDAPKRRRTGLSPHMSSSV